MNNDTSTRIINPTSTSLSTETKQIEIFDPEDIVVFEPSKMLNVPSSAIHIENNISLVQKKLWFELVYFAFPKMGSQRTYSITLKRLRELLGWSESTSSDDRLKEALRGLNQITVNWNIFGKDNKNVWESFPLLAGCRIPEHSGICLFSLSPFLEDRFLAMGEEAYVKIDLIISKKFQSKYALSIYCLALDYLMIELGYSEKKFSMEDLRRYLALKEGEYKLNADMNRWIIKPSEEEINNTSDMNIKIEPFKDGKKISGYKLCMSLKEGRAKEYLERKNKFRQLIESKQEEEQEEPKQIKIVVNIQNENLKKFFAKHHISITTEKIQSKLREIQEMFGQDKLENYLSFLINYAESEQSRGNVKNFSGFFVNLLTDNTQFDNYLFNLEKEKEKEEQKRKKIESMLETELKNKYDLFVNEDFKSYLTNNIDTLEQKLIDLIHTTLKPGSFEYDVAITKMNNGRIDKSLITGTRQSVKETILNHTVKYKEKFGYKAITFREWKSRTVNEEYLNELRKELDRK